MIVNMVVSVSSGFKQHWHHPFLCMRMESFFPVHGTAKVVLWFRSQRVRSSVSDQACRSNRNSGRSISEVEDVEDAEEEEGESRSRIPIAAMRPNCFAGGGKTPRNQGVGLKFLGVGGQGVHILGMVSTHGLSFTLKSRRR